MKVICAVLVGLCTIWSTRASDLPEPNKLEVGAPLVEDIGSKGAGDDLLPGDTKIWDWPNSSPRQIEEAGKLINGLIQEIQKQQSPVLKQWPKSSEGPAEVEDLPKPEVGKPDTENTSIQWKEVGDLMIEILTAIKKEIEEEKNSKKKTLDMGDSRSFPWKELGNLIVQIIKEVKNERGLKNDNARTFPWFPVAGLIVDVIKEWIDGQKAALRTIGADLIAQESPQLDNINANKNPLVQIVVQTPAANIKRSWLDRKPSEMRNNVRSSLARKPSQDVIWAAAVNNKKPWLNRKPSRKPGRLPLTGVISGGRFP